MCSCRSEDKPKDALDEARQLAERGNYAEALQKHIWFHDHALESNPGMYGVRLSFALSAWVELGEKYPKALEALKEIRDKKTARLDGGEANRDLFHDVVAINEHLGQSPATVTLFKQIEARQPEFANSIFDLVDEALVEAGEYQLARNYLGDPADRLAIARRNYEEGLQFAETRSRNAAASRQAFENIFTEKALRLIVILDKTGDRTAARQIQSDVLKVLDNAKLRNALAPP